MQSETQRRWIVILLAVSCLFAILLLWNTEPVVQKKLTTSSQLDSLITVTFEDMELRSNQIRRRTIEVDSLFNRSVYNLRVAPNFSKTTLHYTLQETLWPYGVRTVAKIEFPRRDMHIHMIVNNNIRRSIIIKEDSELWLQQDQPIILPGQNSHEVD
jgi:hypothetical protein